jgi:hypothetical protein
VRVTGFFPCSVLTPDLLTLSLMEPSLDDGEIVVRARRSAKVMIGSLQLLLNLSGNSDAHPGVASAENARAVRGDEARVKRRDTTLSA